MKVLYLVALVLACIAIATAEVYFSEKFDKGWEDRWVKAYPKKEQDADGEWGWSAGKFFNDEEEDKGIQTTQDAKFYTISAEHKDFSNKGKDLIVQYTVKFEQNIDCGGGYIKLYPKSLDQEKMNDQSDYNIMFGPDICGSSTKKVHVIFSHDGKNHLIKKEIRPETDELTHIYRLHVKPDNTYSVSIDGEEKQTGTLEEDWDLLPPKQIKDPKASKPSDWVDEKEIDDPTDKKPDGWDDTPAEVSDPDAKKPEDWDDDLDGEWEAPSIPNPDYKGEWKAKRIPNPEYKGEWVHPLVDNPDYKSNAELYAYPSFKYVGVDVWQVKSGTIFDNILITDDVKVADEWSNKSATQRAGEKKAYDAHKEAEEKKREEERKAREAEEAAKKEKEDDKEDDKEEDQEEDKEDRDEL